MRVVIQRVSKAGVTVDGKVHGTIGLGLLLFLGIEDADGEEDIVWLSNKIVNLRIFNDEAGVMNRSVLEVGGGILLISQFTLHASTKKGNRPSYIRASKPYVAIPLYEKMIQQLQWDLGKEIATGIFGADMKVELLNDGPVTIFIDTKNKEWNLNFARITRNLMKRDVASRNDLERMLAAFYSKVFQDEVIGRFFTQVVPLDLKTHLPVITDFWEAIVFNKHTYRKNVMQVHQHIHQLSPIRKEHLDRWVTSFTETVDEFFEGSKAELMKQRAASVATLMNIKLNHTNLHQLWRMDTNKDILYKTESFRIIGLCMKVHNTLGKGFKEVVYKDALEIELKHNVIFYEREKPFDVYYNKILLPHKFIVDFFVEDKILLEIKATSFIHADAFRQTLNYLKVAQSIKLGIIVNFGSDKLEYKRVILRSCLRF